jgi:hypothetical protein
MARAKIAAGAEIEILTQDELRVELGPVRRAIERLSQDGHAILKRFQGSEVTDASGDCTIVINDGPPADSLWDIRRLGIVGQTEAAITGAAWVYRNGIHPLNFMDYTLVLPAVGPWASRQLSLFGTERLIIHIDGAPATSRIFVNGQAWQRQRDGLDVPGEVP